MSQSYESIDDPTAAFIAAQHVFFVASAPADGGHVNLSPKGLDTLRVPPRPVRVNNLRISAAD